MTHESSRSTDDGLDTGRFSDPFRMNPKQLAQEISNHHVPQLTWLESLTGWLYWACQEEAPIAREKGRLAGKISLVCLAVLIGIAIYVTTSSSMWAVLILFIGSILVYGAGAFIFHQAILSERQKFRGRKSVREFLFSYIDQGLDDTRASLESRADSIVSDIQNLRLVIKDFHIVLAVVKSGVYDQQYVDERKEVAKAYPEDHQEIMRQLKQSKEVLQEEVMDPLLEIIQSTRENAEGRLNKPGESEAASTEEHEVVGEPQPADHGDVGGRNQGQSEELVEANGEESDTSASRQ